MAPPTRQEKLRSTSRRKDIVAQRRCDYEALDALVQQRDRKLSKTSNEKLTAKPKPLSVRTRPVVPFAKVDLKPVLPFDQVDHKMFQIDSTAAIERAPSRRTIRHKSRRFSKASKTSRRSSILRSRSVGGDFDPDLLEHTDDEDNIFHAPYNMVCFGSDGKEGFYLEPRSKSDSAQHLRSLPSEEPLAQSQPWSSRAPLPPRQPWATGHSSTPLSKAASLPSQHRTQINQKACKRSLLRWMANNMCKTPFVKHH